MFINNFDPVAVQILSIDIKWYSVAYIVGILLGWILSKKIFISDHHIKEKFDDFITYIILGIIVGGRLGYVFFYNFGYYSDNLLDIIKIWQGGMSFHGGLLGLIVGTIIFSKNKGFDKSPTIGSNLSVHPSSHKAYFSKFDLMRSKASCFELARTKHRILRFGQRLS